MLYEETIHIGLKILAIRSINTRTVKISKFQKFRREISKIFTTLPCHIESQYSLKTSRN